MKNLIEQTKWDKTTKDKVKSWLKSLRCYNADGQLMLDETSVKRLIELIDWIIECTEIGMMESVADWLPDQMVDRP